MGKHLEAPMGMENPESETVSATSIPLAASFLIVIPDDIGDMAVLPESVFKYMILLLPGQSHSS